MTECLDGEPRTTFVRQMELQLLVRLLRREHGSKRFTGTCRLDGSRGFWQTTCNSLEDMNLETLHTIICENNLYAMGTALSRSESVTDIDSFDFLKLVVSLHDTFGVDVPESDYRRIATLKGLTDYVMA